MMPSASARRAISARVSGYTRTVVVVRGAMASSIGGISSGYNAAGGARADAASARTRAGRARTPAAVSRIVPPVAVIEDSLPLGDLPLARGGVLEGAVVLALLMAHWTRYIDHKVSFTQEMQLVSAEIDPSFVSLGQVVP